MTNHEQILEQIEVYIKEHASFEEKGVKSSSRKGS